MKKNKPKKEYKVILQKIIEENSKFFTLNTDTNYD